MFVSSWSWSSQISSHDLNLILQIVTLAVIFVSLYYKNKHKLRHHGATMALAIILHLLSFVLVMGPAFFTYFEFYSTQTSILAVLAAWIHAVPGAIALLLDILLVATWAVNASNVAGCHKRKKLMTITLLLSSH